MEEEVTDGEGENGESEEKRGKVESLVGHAISDEGFLLMGTQSLIMRSNFYARQGRDDATIPIYSKD